MKMKFKISFVFFVLVPLFVFAGCSNSSGSSGGSGSGSGNSGSGIEQFIGKYKGTLTNGNENLDVELKFKDSDGWESGWYRVEYSYHKAGGMGAGLEDWQASGSKVFSKEDSETHGRLFEGSTSDNGATIDLDFYTSKHTKKWTGKVTKQ